MSLPPCPPGNGILKLPMELWDMIFVELAGATGEWYKAVFAKDALLACCLTCRWWQKRAQPLLDCFRLTSIVIRTEEELAAAARLPQLRRLEGLVIHPFQDTDQAWVSSVPLRLAPRLPPLDNLTFHSIDLRDIGLVY